MPPSKTVGRMGVPGAAALTAALGLWLAYAGVRDVPVFEGLRQLLRKEQPAPRTAHSPYEPGPVNPASGSGAARVHGAAGDKGIEGLVGNAATAYPKLKAKFPELAMNGWRATGSVPDSDHPRGLAIDVMTTNALKHTQVIAMFRGLPGAKYWISMGRIASASNSWRIRGYDGPSPHTDHVHLSFS